MRLIAEVALLVGAFLYLLAALREARFLGLNMMIENLVIILHLFFTLIYFSYDFFGI